MFFDDEVADAEFQGRMMVSCYIEQVKTPLECDWLGGVTTKPKGDRFFFQFFSTGNNFINGKSPDIHGMYGGMLGSHTSTCFSTFLTLL